MPDYDTDNLADEIMAQFEAQMENLNERIAKWQERAQSHIERDVLRAQARLSREIRRLSRRLGAQLDPEVVGQKAEEATRKALEKLEELDPEEIGRKVEEATRKALEQLRSFDPEEVGRRAEEAARQAKLRLEKMESRRREMHFRPSEPTAPRQREVTQEELALILKMVEEGKITAEEASKLIEALR